MYELVKLGEKTYFVDCPSRIGIYKINEADVCLVDSGNSAETGKKVLKICREQGWRITHIVNTHAHADHVGGNAVMQDRTGCTILANERDLCQINHPTLNNSYTFGARPVKELNNKFMLAEKSTAQQITEDNIPNGLSFEVYPGHAFDQIAVICDDGTVFTGDILCGADIIEKYHIFFIQDPDIYIESAKRICATEARVFCAAHYSPIYSKEELIQLAQYNISKIYEQFALIKRICNEGKNFETVMKEMLDFYNLKLSFNQYAIAGSTIRGFLSCLHDKGELDAYFEDNFLFWKTVKS